jgi:hypothetical protein
VESPSHTSEILIKYLVQLSGLENRDYGSRDSSRWPRGTLYPQKLALISLTSGGRSTTQTTEFSIFDTRTR